MSADDDERTFDGVRLGRPATQALLGAGYRTVDDLPGDLAVLTGLHGVGPSAIARLAAAQVATPPTDRPVQA